MTLNGNVHTSPTAPFGAKVRWSCSQGFTVSDNRRALAVAGSPVDGAVARQANVWESTCTQSCEMSPRIDECNPMTCSNLDDVFDLGSAVPVTGVHRIYDQVRVCLSVCI